jgi:hypothetical protein
MPRLRVPITYVAALTIAGWCVVLTVCQALFA